MLSISYIKRIYDHKKYARVQNKNKSTACYARKLKWQSNVSFQTPLAWNLLNCTPTQQQTEVDQRIDNAIQWLNLYPVDWTTISPLDSVIHNFEQLGTSNFPNCCQFFRSRPLLTSSFLCVGLKQMRSTWQQLQLTMNMVNWLVEVLA